MLDFKWFMMNKQHAIFLISSEMIWLVMGMCLSDHENIRIMSCLIINIYHFIHLESICSNGRKHAVSFTFFLWVEMTFHVLIFPVLTVVFPNKGTQ